ncbi:MAG: APC family permease [Fibrobacterota bacterium]|nr:APC family permease [Fibrobacterota bacterium]QQS05786.1 MAG: APC family permease [Fibrobacterota bacterium]
MPHTQIPQINTAPDLSGKGEGLSSRIRHALFGNAKDPFDHSVFHKLALLPFFAWVGLGADGLSSSCYGPEEAFKALGAHPSLALFVALCTAITVLVISASYTQIIKLFPTGGGGYLVASKLLSPKWGMFSGSALVIDYVLTITLSIASCGDAIFSFVPAHFGWIKLPFELVVLALLAVLNLRGAKESVKILVPIFLVFVATHLAAILWAVGSNLPDASRVASETGGQITSSVSALGLLPALVLVLRAYSMGAGTFTGIEAVSNGLPILREPRVQTGRRTMLYMAVSLSFTSFGLMVAYLLHAVHPVAGKTLNAVLFEQLAGGWGTLGTTLVMITLISEGALLFVAAQAGFLDGPRVLSNMAIDRWVPSRFAHLSDRLVTQNGILVMAIASFAVLALSRGNVGFLVVLYSINVFITFTLSQLGMVVHWIKERREKRSWLRPFLVSGLGCGLSAFILTFVVAEKFTEGGWLTLVITLGFSGIALLVRRHYQNTQRLLKRLDSLVEAAGLHKAQPPAQPVPLDPKARTAVLLVNGWNGLGLHSLFSILRIYGDFYENFVILHVGLLDAGTFKGIQEVEALRIQSQTETDKYVEYLRANGRKAQGRCTVHADVVDALEELARNTAKDFPKSVFFGGQLVFRQEGVWTRLLHNNVVFAIQRRLYLRGLPFMVLPVRVD